MKKIILDQMKLIIFYNKHQHIYLKKDILYNILSDTISITWKRIP